MTENVITLSQRQCCIVVVGWGQKGVKCGQELEIGGEPVQGVEFILGYPFCTQVFMQFNGLGVAGTEVAVHRQMKCRVLIFNC